MTSTRSAKRLKERECLELVRLVVDDQEALLGRILEVDGDRHLMTHEKRHEVSRGCDGDRRACGTPGAGRRPPLLTELGLTWRSPRPRMKLSWSLTIFTDYLLTGMRDFVKTKSTKSADALF